LGWWRSWRLVGAATAISVVVVAAAALTQSTGSGLLLCFAGAIDRKGEFIDVSYRLILHDFSNN
jgi:hypothetical protein